mmetsp:Transcript_61136/g.162420  ORF Transcript_61136/g.162420 Transcript_61136/m.162420 type:complete len:379 (+) Transcript_61136:234-1370(+)
MVCASVRSQRVASPSRPRRSLCASARLDWAISMHSLQLPPSAQHPRVRRRLIQCHPPPQVQHHALPIEPACSEHQRDGAHGREGPERTALEEVRSRAGRVGIVNPYVEERVTAATKRHVRLPHDGLDLLLQRRLDRVHCLVIVCRGIRLTALIRATRHVSSCALSHDHLALLPLGQFVGGRPNGHVRVGHDILQHDRNRGQVRFWGISGGFVGSGAADAIPFQSGAVRLLDHAAPKLAPQDELLEEGDIAVFENIFQLLLQLCRQLLLQPLQLLARGCRAQVVLFPLERFAHEVQPPRVVLQRRLDHDWESPRLLAHPLHQRCHVLHRAVTLPNCEPPWHHPQGHAARTSQLSQHQARRHLVLSHHVAGPRHASHGQV